MDEDQISILVSVSDIFISLVFFFAKDKHVGVTGTYLVCTVYKHYQQHSFQLVVVGDRNRLQ